MKVKYTYFKSFYVLLDDSTGVFPLQHFLFPALFLFHIHVMRRGGNLAHPNNSETLETAAPALSAAAALTPSPIGLHSVGIKLERLKHGGCFWTTLDPALTREMLHALPT